MVLVELLFLDGDVFDLLKKYQGILQRFTFENSKAQKYFLGGMEKLIESREDLCVLFFVLFNSSSSVGDCS